MADRKQHKKADQSDIHSDDPFAELTRIMGFDPRVPVTRAQPSSIQKTPSAAPDEDDLSIDLEKELISEFEDLENGAVAAAAEPAPVYSPASSSWQVRSASNGATQPTEDFDVVFDAELTEPVRNASIADDLETALDEELEAALVGGQSWEELATGESAEVRGDAQAEEVTASGETARYEASETFNTEAADQPLAEEDALVEEFHAALAEESASVASENWSEDTEATEFANPLVDAIEKTFITREEAVEPEAQAQIADAEPATDDFDASDEVPLIPLGAARDFARLEDAEAPVDMDFEAEFAAELEQDGPKAAQADDDLEAELSALLGKTTAAVASHAGVAPSEDFSSEDAEHISDMLTKELAAAADTAYDSEESGFSEVVPQSHTHDDAGVAVYDEAVFAAHEAAAERAEELDHRAEFPEFDHTCDPVEVPEPEPQDGYGHLAEEQVEDRVQRFRQPTDADGQAVFEPSETVSAQVFDDPMDEQPLAYAGVAPQPAAASETRPQEEDDPFAALAELMRSPSAVSASSIEQDVARSYAPRASESPTAPGDYQYQNHSYVNRAPVNVPDIETVDVPEAAVALADDLEIPDVAFEDDLPLAADFDDFEAELASAFGQQAGSGTASASVEAARLTVRDVPREAYHNEFEQPAHPAAGVNYASGAAMAAGAVLATQAAASDSRARDRDHDFDNLGGIGGQASGAYRAGDEDDLDFDPALNEEMAIPSYRDAERRPSSRRGLLIAAVAGGLAVVGGIAALAWNSGSGGSDAPALVRADTDPIKVRPENPGGTVVPNQDNKVFQTMNGTETDAAPTQEKLISGNEEPVDVAARAQPPADASDVETVEDAMLMADDETSTDDPIADEIASAPKGEDRVAANGADEASLNDPVIAVAPRRVRTMVVRPDGTLVPSEEPVVSGTETASSAEVPAGSDAAALEPADPSKDLADPTVAPESTASLKPDNAAPTEPAAAPTQSAPDTNAAAPKAKTAAPKPHVQAKQSSIPASGPVAPSRPADQPLEVVGEVQPQKVAAATTAATPAGAWSVQIASQPSEAAAKSSYADLARRYGSVIGDRGVNIVKAEIAGKGTFWRVRVPAGTRNEAVSLCESYKAAGGNCFVSK